MVEPGEKVRFGLFPSFNYTRDSDTGALTGFGIELARQLAEAQGRTLLLKEYDAPPAVVQALKNDECDVALLGLDPDRGMEVDFSPPYLKADFTFLVPADSGIDRIAQVDQPGQRVAVVRGHAMEIALRGKLHQADRVFAQTPDEGFDMLRTGQADVQAGILPGLLAYAGQLAGARVLPDSYGENVLALAVAKGNDGWLHAINRFVRDARHSGLIEQIVNETGLAGVSPVLNS